LIEIIGRIEGNAAIAPKRRTAAEHRQFGQCGGGAMDAVFFFQVLRGGLSAQIFASGHSVTFLSMTGNSRL
jgi:hypothetical protein